MEPHRPQKSPIVQEVPPGEYWWCACGQSKEQPFCDGSHRGTSFRPKLVKIEKPQKVAWCACKGTKNPPFCDGTHRTL
ncbi:MAG: CDGSH iron-sulfur domain-containing protein [Planctomycetota bacterium]